MPWHDLPKAAAPAPAVISAAAGVKKAQQQLTSLRNKRQAAEQRRLDLETEREEIALSVHGGGQKENRQRLTEINLNIATHASELASIDSAIGAGTAALAAANFAAERAGRRADAERALALSQEMSQAGALAAEALVATVVRIRRFTDLAVEAHRLGHGSSSPLIAANMRRSVSSALYELGLGDLLPVSQRVALGALLQSYADRTAASARAAVAEGQAEEETAA
jgi:hypothetical protein